MAKGSLLSPELRASTRSRVEPIARLFGRVGLTPNALSVIGLLTAAVAALAAANQAWLAAGLLVIFGAAFDLFDGALARATGQTSTFGAFLDSSLDRAGEAVVYVGVVISATRTGFEPAAWLAAAAMGAAFMVSYTRAKSESLGFSPATGMANVGLAPREVRIAILTVTFVLTGVFGGLVPAAIFDGNDGTSTSLNASGDFILAGGLGLITLLATITTIQRILVVRSQAISSSQSEDHR